MTLIWSLHYHESHLTHLEIKTFIFSCFLNVQMYNILVNSLQKMSSRDRDRQRQTEIDKDRQRQAETHRDTQRQTETARDRQRQTEIVRDRQGQTVQEQCHEMRKNLHSELPSLLRLASKIPRCPLNYGTITGVSVCLCSSQDHVTEISFYMNLLGSFHFM